MRDMAETQPIEEHEVRAQMTQQAGGKGVGAVEMRSTKPRQRRAQQEKPMKSNQEGGPRKRIGQLTPMTAHVLEQTGGWAKIIREEYEWMSEDDAEARAQAHNGDKGKVA